MTFRYSGSKQRLLKYLPAPPSDTQVFVEPFAGSLSYSLHYCPLESVITGADANPYIRGLWEWLSLEATQTRLVELEALQPKEKVDLRSLGLSEPETTLMRLHVSGAYVGQLSSWINYPQHKFKLARVKENLHKIKECVEVLWDDYRVCQESEHYKCFFFIDPPYLKTSANYKSKKDHGAIDPKEVEQYILSLTSPTLVTYGDGAQETFPNLKWEKICERKVPILRGGGTKLRSEFIARVNW